LIRFPIFDMTIVIPMTCLLYSNASSLPLGALLVVLAGVAGVNFGKPVDAWSRCYSVPRKNQRLV
jgi:hypothetical protein